MPPAPIEPDRPTTDEVVEEGGETMADLVARIEAQLNAKYGETNAHLRWK